ncbi:wsv229 [White spot syndrome virus]|uniref:Wsv229 n=4 Tax=White spot syndrome virus TaxID=342409 RepID=Q8VAY7_WSSVS|nr:wsv229 [Shrimp white spot syndrome virus]AFX59606.1 wsv229 [White spot syndrome virus]AAL33233.1 wsv229 [Shrimp white spot syndrome virus]AAL89152.1 WSSV284 [Shrimp white spot syndrome virus]AWQ60400.1 wsv229 [Shrimp white spot syndrome virus]AWQ60815.1 wsv229 [Shrimp white spot syndrome virus]
MAFLLYHLGSVCLIKKGFFTALIMLVFFLLTRVTGEWKSVFEQSIAALIRKPQLFSGVSIISNP